MQRVIEPEWLDELPAEEPRAIASRADLRRLNGFMNHAGIFAGALRASSPPRRVLDLGGGDGSFALRLARALGWRGCELVIVDRNPILPANVHDGFAAQDCAVTSLRCDVLQGLDSAGKADIAFANLFLHHFEDGALKRLLKDAASHCKLFLACEPRRSPVALMASHCVALLGCNAVTRHDAVISVRAGFQAEELTRLWVKEGWKTQERGAGFFSHLFVAQKL